MSLLSEAVAFAKTSFADMVQAWYEQAMKTMPRHSDDTSSALELIMAFSAKATPTLKWKHAPAIRDRIFVRYINEIWLGELSDKFDKIDTGVLLRNIITDNKENFESTLKSRDDRPWLIIHNLAIAVYAIFADDEPENASPAFRDKVKAARDAVNVAQEFSVDLARAIHKVVADGLIQEQCDGSNAGEYAKGIRSAGPVIFTPPSMIASQMDILFERTNHFMKCVKQQEKTDGPSLTTYRILMLGAIFFRMFLLIHPFPDANGRTARILLSILVADHTLVPLSLYIAERKDPRQEYGNVLVRCPYGTYPKECIDYVLSCAVYQNKVFMDINDSA